MKIAKRFYTTDKNEYGYTVISATTDDGVDIGAFEMIIPQPQNPNRRSTTGHAWYWIIQECIKDFGMAEMKRKYNKDGTVTIYGN